MRGLCIPADRVCCGCLSINQAAISVCFYYVFTGIVQIVSIFAMAPTKQEADKEHHLTRTSDFLAQLHIFYQILGFAVGTRGYRGVALREPHNVRIAFLFTCSYASMALCGLMRLSVVCDEYPEVECAKLKAVLAGSVGCEFFLFTYFAYILWSCCEKLTAGAGDVLPRFMLDESLISTNQLPVPQQRGSQTPLTAPIEPFSGQGHRLE
ncbi:unnamed protein product [Amoebophrya sp. A120]|nr:unnamed protein product [Amoebophrya sp. A120]|eukprot:GSA120T00021489001.1